MMGGDPIQKTIIIEPTPVIIVPLPAPWYESTWAQIAGASLLLPLIVAVLTRRFRRDK